MSPNTGGFFVYRDVKWALNLCLTNKESLNSEYFVKTNIEY